MIEKSPESSQSRLIEKIGSEGKVIDDVLYKNANIILFEGKEHIISHRAILTVTVTEKCNAGCKFCFNGITNTPSGPYLNPGDPRIERLRQLLTIAGVQKIAYSGGEPTLNPQKLYKLVRALNPSFRKSRLHTNGYGLLRHIENAEHQDELLLSALTNVGLSGISLSVAHHDTEQNRKIMDFRGWQGLSESEIKEIVSLSDGMSLRLSCYLTEEGIHTVDDVQSYIDWGRSLGIHSFIFRSGSIIPDAYAKDTEFSKYNKGSVQDIDPLAESMIRLGYTETYQQHKSDSHVHVLTKDNVTVDIDHSSEEPDPDRKIRRFNLMPNSVCYTSWINQTATLFEEDRGVIIDDILKNYRQKLAASFPAAGGHILSLPQIESSAFSVDLHSHTWNSDGRTSETKLIQHAVSRGLKALAITEHNAIAENHDDIVREAAQMGLEIPFPAVEISTVFRGEDGERKYHVLAFGSKLRDPEFLRTIGQGHEYRNNFYREVVNHLRDSNGIDIPTLEDIMKGKQPDGRYLHPYKFQIQRTTIASYVAQALSIPLQTAKEQYVPLLPEGTPYVDTVEAIRMVNDLGGIAGVAHPVWDRPQGNAPSIDMKRTLEILYFLRKQGMAGLEVRHYKHDQDVTRILSRFALELGLLAFGGSDYHGNGKSELGTYGVSEREFMLIKQRLKL